MELSTRYNAAETEAKWYKHWQEKGYFHSTPNEKEPYTIVLPPPNVTGVLHMGHLLNITIHDVLIRKARLDGKNACWVPGTDHASIATENKVIDLLKSQGIKKSDISREEFLKHAFAWKEKYGGIIIEQLKLMGASCDWERTRFTMEDKLSNAVTWSFVDLYRKGYIYKGLRMCNWDCEVKTALGNEEVIHSEETSKLFFINYPFAEGDGHITIATTRPETIMADVAIAVNPKDERYTHLVGKMVKIPLLGKAIPIIADSYVKMDFGTGALKITPAHDLNDFEVGRRHNLEVIDILNEDGTLNEKAQLYVGKDRFIVRKIIAKDLEAAGFLAKTEEHLNKVGRSERNKSIIEPRLTEQWFLKMDKFAASALAAVEKGEVNFLPKDFLNMYRSWLQPENVRFWFIYLKFLFLQQIDGYFLV
jgi:valyl-tRNA synthetase